MTTLVQASHVGKRSRSGSSIVDALTDVDLRIAAGDTVAIVGPPGSGKSTLLSLIGGLDRPTSGTIVPLFDASLVTLGAAVALAVSLVAGWLPARRAARLIPADALRAE